MSSGLFLPSLLGLGWNVIKTPIWATKVQTSVNGKELRAAFWSRPRWKFTLTYDMLRADVNADLQKLMGFFNQMKGSFDDFYFADPTDFVATAQVIGVGDGVNKTFQLQRAIDNFSDLVLANSTGTFLVYDNGSSVPYTARGYGINDSSVTLTSAPIAGHSVTWTGTYIFRCRFMQDMADFENFMYQLWSLKKLEFISTK